MTRFGKYCRTVLAGTLGFGGAVAISVVGASLSTSSAAAATTSSHSLISLAGPLRSALPLRSSLPLRSKRIQEPILPTLGLPGDAGLGGSLDLPKAGKADSSASNSSAWKVEPSANVLDKGGLLYTDSCGSANACMGVGYYIDKAGLQETLAEAWNGSKWSVQKLPKIPADEASAFFGVSCASAIACTAVGAYRDSSGVEVSLAEVWNGTSWSIGATPNPSGAAASALAGVSCASASKCIAVGSSKDSSGNVTTLVEKRTGTSWSIVASPNPSGAQGSVLSDVSCTSLSACTAVGDYVDSSGVQYTLAEAWNGTSMSIQTTPNPSGSLGPILNGVACSSASACTAVGDYIGSGGEFTLAEAWNGISWSIETTPNPSGAVASALVGVACNSTGACTAVGVYAGSSDIQNTLAEAWNGSSWSVETTPDPAGAQGSDLAGVACNSSGGCTAVGSFTNSAAIGVTLAEVWNGNSWSVETTPNPKGVARASQLFDVACASANACTAVGLDVSSSDVQVTLAEAWNGTKWSIQTTPNPSGALQSQLSSVSCTSASACTAVGYYVDSSDVAVTLAEAWNGSSWSIQTTPNPSGAQASELTNVACTSASACTAVGYWIGSPYSQNALVEVWNGTSWSIQTIAAPSGSQATALYGVACTSAACTIVGAYLDSSSNVLTLAEAWNGSSWSVETTPNPSGAQGSLLNGVSCTSASVCTAVGDYADSSGNQNTFAEAWNGTAWSIETTPDPTGGVMNTLTGVSCTSAIACTAVGSYIASPQFTVPLAEAWNGTSWSIQPVPVPAGAPGSLSGVACTAGGCTAAGSYVTTVEVTLIEVK